MLRIYCPICEEARDEPEYHYAGQAHIVRPIDPDQCNDQEWGEYLYFRSNLRGLHREMWYHAAGCRKFFNVLRDTQSHEVKASYRLGATPPEQEEVRL